MPSTSTTNDSLSANDTIPPFHFLTELLPAVQNERESYEKCYESPPLCLLANIVAPWHNANFSEDQVHLNRRECCRRVKEIPLFSYRLAPDLFGCFFKLSVPVITRILNINISQESLWWRQQ